MKLPGLLFVDNVAVEAAKRMFYRAIAAAGEFEVHLLVPATWKEQQGVVAAEPEPDPRVHLHVSSILFGHRQHRVLYCALPGVLRNVRPALVYLDTEPENYAAVQARCAVRRASPESRIALVSSRNMDYRATGFPYKAAFTHRWCDGYILRHPVDALYVRPHDGFPLLNGYARQMLSLPHVIDCSVFTPTGDVLVPHEGLSIGYLGRLVPEKGLDILIRACATLPGDTRLLIAGEGPMRGELEQLASASGMRGRVVFLGAIPYVRVPSFLRSLDVVALPSRSSDIWVEQFGRVLIEAMACGVPVVASASGEIPTVLGEVGLLVPPGEVNALGDVLRSLVSSPDHRRQFGDAGRARAVAIFDAAAIAATFLHTVRHVLSSPSAAPARA